MRSAFASSRLIPIFPDAVRSPHPPTTSTRCDPVLAPGWANSTVTSMRVGHLTVLQELDAGPELLQTPPFVTVPNDIYTLPIVRTENIGRELLSDGRQVIDALLDTKFDGRSYEGEIRVFAPQDGSHVEDGLEFMPFSDKTVSLREIILGERCPLSVAQFPASIPHINSCVSIIKTQRALHDFRLEPDPDAV